MAYNNYQQAPFWDFVRSFDQNGAGVDHPEGHPFGHAAAGVSPPPLPPGAMPGSFPLGGYSAPFAAPFGPFGFGGGFGGPGAQGRGGRHGRRGRHCRRERSGERSRSRSRTASPGPEHREGEGRDGPADGHHGPHGPGRHGRGGHRGGWGGHGRRGPGGMGGMGGFDLSGLFDALDSHPMGQQPWAQMLRQYAQQAGLAGDAPRSSPPVVPDDTESSFTPPIDVFSTETAYVLHIALPGAKKDDVGVNWDAEKGVLNVAGVVYRQGEEEFLKTLSQSERKVGMFERSVKLPPGNEEKEEVDGDSITAKLEDGVLVVTVYKVEKEWTEVKKVDIN